MKNTENDDLRKEYDLETLGKGTRGKYREAYEKGTNVIMLPPDIAKSFPTQESVTRALRWLIQHKLISTAMEK